MRKALYLLGKRRYTLTELLHETDSDIEYIEQCPGLPISIPF